MTPKPSLLIGLNGALAVALGAFGAHGLKSRLDTAGMLSVWDTAVHYHLAHAIACLAIFIWAEAQPNRAKKLRVALFSWLIGCLLFAGSLYWLALGGPKFLGPITPLGGVALIIGWITISLEGLRRNAK